ncbi:CD3324 family protein [Clostridium sp. C2-6-12]|uniref:CD3324 family protein n=1 Tax=Clostridium sp. C2-6-12 TaxID=2698832 RepID=UPI00136B602F|nr:CD3324 family protein [Clostridium sp. C2-6-12]
MKYRKASDVLPDELLKEVQKYVSGEALYFPKYKSRQKWGESTGAKDYYKQRNIEIREKFAQKISIESLAEQYNLSIESIRKIVYQQHL